VAATLVEEEEEAERHQLREHDPAGRTDGVDRRAHDRVAFHEAAAEPEQGHVAVGELQQGVGQQQDLEAGEGHEERQHAATRSKLRTIVKAGNCWDSGPQGRADLQDRQGC